MKSFKKFLIELVQLLAVCIPMCIGGIEALALTPKNWELAYTLLQCFLVLPAVLVQVILHEAGHLVCGQLSGYQLSSFQVFCFKWVQEGDSVVFRFGKPVGESVQCILVPPDLKNGRMPAVLYLAGGMISNLAFSVIFGLLVVAFHGIPVLSVFLTFLAASGLFLVLYNGLPLDVGLIWGDSAELREVQSHPQAVRAMWCQMKVQEAASRNVRLKDMPESWFCMPQGEELHNRIEAAQGLYLAQRRIEEHRFAEADTIIRQLLQDADGLAEAHRNVLLAEQLYLEVVFRNRPEVVANLLTPDVEKYLHSNSAPEILRIRYAVALLADQDEKRAKRYSKTFLRTAGRYSYPAEIAAQQELMELAESKAKAPVPV